jgi:hypothetical protein
MQLPDIYNYADGHTILVIQVVPGTLPDSIHIEGLTLKLKSEFHITLVSSGRIAQLLDPGRAVELEAEIAQAFQSFIQKQPLENYEVFHSFRFVQRGDRKTIIAMASVDHLEDFFTELREKYQKDIPSQPTHTTLYTLQPDQAIGLLSDNELATDSKPIEVAGLERLQFMSNTLD